MAISVVPVTCPQCGANLNVESGREFAFCTYCGTKILINNDNVHVYRTIDEASMLQAETDRIIRLRELELQEKEAKRKRVFKLLPYMIALSFILIGLIISIFNDDLGWGLFGLGAIIGMYTFLFSLIKHNKDKDD